MSRRAREIMNPELYKVDEDAKVGDVLARLTTLEVSACPVIREDGRLRGVVTVGSIAMADRLESVATFASAPGMTVAEDATVTDLAQLMTDTGEHHAVVVTATGYVVGIVSTIDVIRELCDSPPAWPDPFPHFDARYDVHWSNQAPFDLDGVRKSPNEPGVFSILCRAGGADDHVVWSEYSTQLRDRLLDLLAEPTAELPSLCSLLSTANLRFRVALVSDETHGHKVVDSLQRLSGQAVEQ